MLSNDNCCIHLRRAALLKWKQYQGSGATYRNLIAAFERAGHQDFADTVHTIASKCQCSLVHSTKYPWFNM